ncbi:unnamed protein product [Rangifer tarandus platyrhynchus]|uniref:Uncharacterized protein n=2 Tax=Rangifer tarandus platyrhynchus TaxID=3082113 RepID=A0ABN8Y528_RANTA|nr:unnamed protein product [Rangifer tarandus platyrhynchus]
MWPSRGTGLGHGLCWGRSSQLQERLPLLPEDRCLVGTWVTCWEARGSPITLTSLALGSTLRQPWHHFRVALNLSFNAEAESRVAFQMECLKHLIILIKSQGSAATPHPGLLPVVTPRLQRGMEEQGRASAGRWRRDSRLGWQVCSAGQVVAQPCQQFPEAPAAPLSCTQAWKLKDAEDGSGCLTGTLVPRAGLEPRNAYGTHPAKASPQKQPSRAWAHGLLSNCAAPTPGLLCLHRAKPGAHSLDWNREPEG